MTHDAALMDFVSLCEQAGRTILTMTPAGSSLKNDGSIVTPADMTANAILLDGVAHIFGSNTPVLSEEAVIAPPTHGDVIVIDPLDGSSNYQKGSKEYAVLAAILKNGIPVFGVCVMPAYGISIYGGTLSNRLDVRRMHGGAAVELDEVKALCALSPAAVATTIVPQRLWESAKPEVQTHIRSAINDFQSCVGQQAVLPTMTIFGSLLPLLYPQIAYRFYSSHGAGQGACDWDLAAFDALLRSQGGIISTTAGHPLAYLNATKGYKHPNYICHQSAARLAAYAERARNYPCLCA